ncbi:MAG: type II toxin-antitoxin system RelE/ParE family toxin [Verrucomicrobiota bacterium]
MAVTLHKTSLFYSDYVEIVSYISEANPDAADRFCDAVESALELLASHPQLAAKAGFQHAPDVRKWVIRQFPNYVIYYRESPGAAVLLRLLHGARNARELIQNP